MEKSHIKVGIENKSVKSTQKRGEGRMSKVSILMPVYNDETYLEEALKCVLEQKGIDFELIIVDDGSTDKTPEIIQKFKSQNVIYVRHSQNMGQLQAVFTASEYITGDYVTLFHGDDKIADDYAFRDLANALERIKADGIYSDLIVINPKGNVKGKLNVSKKVKRKSLVTLLASAGSNIVSDVFFVTKEYFFHSVVENYVKWNMPYWFCLNGNELKLGKIIYVKRPWYMYRVSEQNYVRSEIGRFVAANGVIRTIVNLSKFIRLPNIPILSRKLKIRLWRVMGRFRRSEPKDLGFRRQIVELLRIVGDTYDVDWLSNLYYKSLITFYSDNRLETVRKVYLTEPIQDPIFYGKDVNLFYQALKHNKVPGIYKYLLDESQKGYFEVVTTAENVSKVSDILKFLNLATNIEVN